jgi:hypothetical protein
MQDITLCAIAQVEYGTAPSAVMEPEMCPLRVTMAVEYAFTFPTLTAPSVVCRSRNASVRPGKVMLPPTEVTDTPQ